MIQVYSGKAPYVTDHDERGQRLLVAVACFVEDLPGPCAALLDTAGE